MINVFSKAVFLLSLVIFLINSAQAGFFGYDNYNECYNDKTADYIDDGSLPGKAHRRAIGYCETKFPKLKTKYKITEVIGAHVTFVLDPSYPPLKGHYKYILMVHKKIYKD